MGVSFIVNALLVGFEGEPVGKKLATVRVLSFLRQAPMAFHPGGGPNNPSTPSNTPGRLGKTSRDQNRCVLCVCVLGVLCFGGGTRFPGTQTTVTQGFNRTYTATA